MDHAAQYPILLRSKWRSFLPRTKVRGFRSDFDVSDWRKDFHEPIPVGSRNLGVDRMSFDFPEHVHECWFEDEHPGHPHQCECGVYFDDAQCVPNPPEDTAQARSRPRKEQFEALGMYEGPTTWVRVNLDGEK